MFQHAQQYCNRRKVPGPDWKETVDYLSNSSKPTAHQRLLEARGNERTLIQPRCGVGDHESMKQLHKVIETRSKPDLLTLTIDAHTRLLRLDMVDRILAESPGNLNGYPLINQGWQKGRDINEATSCPIEIRHGSPDGRLLFEMSVASGFTSYEGGGIGYNIPYCRDVSILDSLRYWEETDALAGALASEGVVIDREFFGTLTAALMPPSICIAVALLEAVSAYRQGVRSLSLAICQTGVPIQDVAALRALRSLAHRFLPADADVFTVLHEFMGVFPRERVNADAMILMGGLVARHGKADKVINKTFEESMGVPTPYANADGIHTVRLAFNNLYDLLELPGDRIDEEQHFIELEVTDLIADITGCRDISLGIAEKFRTGELDVPFSASNSALSKVVPIRDSEGFVRFYQTGNLPFSGPVLNHNRQRLNQMAVAANINYKTIQDSIMRFA